MAHKLPVIEVFGPTVQGEGPDAGRPCYFVRFGGCDYRCSWCDSMYAVEPAEVRANATKMEVGEIIAAIEKLDRGPSLVVLSGGNPALLELGHLVEQLHAIGMEASVETQGSRWKDWLATVDRLVVSPKPPSSGMAIDKHRAAFDEFMAKWHYHYSPLLGKVVLKIVVFDDEDLCWARDVYSSYPSLPLYLSAGTPYADGEPASSDTSVKLSVMARYKWLCEQVAVDPMLSEAVVLPQLHVLAWGTQRGV